MKRAWVPAVCLLLQLLIVTTGGSLPGRSWLWGTVNAVGLAMVFALLWRDRAPEVVLAVTIAGFLIQLVAVGPVIPAAVAVAVQAVTRKAATQKRFDLQALLVAVAVVVVVAGALFGGSAFMAAPFAAALLGAILGGVVRASRAAREVAVRSELVVAERLRIARDLHDVVGHGVGATVVQAGAARMAIAAGDTAEATAGLTTIEGAGRGVLTEVRWLVTLLRADAERPKLADIAKLVADARRSGLEVTLRMDETLAVVSDEIGEAAYRVVQESLTNVVRHSGTQAATVTVVTDHQLHVDIIDQGATVEPPPGEGHGIQGIRERTLAVGGTVSVGPAADGGWAVQARFPIGRRR